MQEAYQPSSNVSRPMAACIILIKRLKALKYYREKNDFFSHSASIKISIVVQVSAAGNICLDRMFFHFLHQPNTFVLSFVFV